MDGPVAEQPVMLAITVEPAAKVRQFTITSTSQYDTFQNSLQQQPVERFVISTTATKKIVKVSLRRYVKDPEKRAAWFVDARRYLNMQPGQF